MKDFIDEIHKNLDKAPDGISFHIPSGFPPDEDLPDGLAKAMGELAKDVIKQIEDKD